MKDFLNTIFSGNSLNRDQAEQAMDKMIDGKTSSEQIAAFLAALKLKKETVEEIVGFVKSMRKNALKIDITHSHLIDVCGTGGDGYNTFNISTACAFVIAGAGIPVAKHGNKAVSSKSGSADVLTELGVRVDFSPQEVEKIINEIGIGFLYAPVFHPAMKNVAPIRQALGVRTVFNILGPLCNPTGLKRQLIGVYDASLVNILAEALLELGSEEVIILSSEDGMDEVSLGSNTFLAHLKKGKIYNYKVSPDDFGISYAKSEELKGGTSKENAEIIEAIFRGKGTEAQENVVLINSATALLVSGLVPDLKTGFSIAKDSIRTGKALKKLEELRQYK